MRSRSLLFTSRLRSFISYLFEIPMVIGMGLLAISLIVVFLLGETFPVSLGLWPLDETGMCYEGYRFWAWLSPMFYFAWSLVLAGFFHRGDSYSLRYMDAEGRDTSEDVAGNRSWEVLFLALLGAVGYHFLHSFMAGTTIVPNMVLYLLQVVGFLIPQGLIEEQAEHEVPVFVGIILIIAGGFVYLGSGLP